MRDPLKKLCATAADFLDQVGTTFRLNANIENKLKSSLSNLIFAEKILLILYLWGLQT